MAEAQQGSETTEEDATDLQFPKGVAGEWGAGSRGQGQQQQQQQEECAHCGVTLHQVHMQCAQCPGPPALCVACFSRGAEFGTHRSYHPYLVVKSVSPLEEGWGAEEELALLGALMECGLGNWGEVSARLPGRSAQECQTHYFKFYLEHPPPDLAGLLGEQPRTSVEQPDPMEYVGGMEQPPRPLPGTVAYRELAGYNAARGDFDLETDPQAEAVVQDLDPDLFLEEEGQVGEEPCLGVALQLALLDLYRRRLGERHTRKRLVRDHGLLTVGRSITALGRYRPFLPQALFEAMPRLLGLLQPPEMDMLLEGLKTESELKRQIGDLLEYRQHGLTRQAGVMTYEALRRRRETNLKERRSLVLVQGCGQGGDREGSWTVLKNTGTRLEVANNRSNRKERLALNITGMPGYDSLTDPERQLASELRLVPEDFLKFKRYMVEECHKNGGLRLTHIRTLIKIDVNKTRKLYDYLLSAGLIHEKDR